MNITDLVLILFIALFIIYLIYDEVVMNVLKGKTYLRVNLKRRNKLDSAIFIGLLLILIYNNTISNGGSLTNYLLISLMLLSIYAAYVRHPKLLFKATGFFYANIFIDYRKIKQMNLTEDGIFVMDLETRRLLIHVVELDDLPKILNLFVQQDLEPTV